MKKTISKLVLRREAVRMLVNTDLACVIGGLDSAALDTYPQTGDKQCPAQAIVAPPGG